MDMFNTFIEPLEAEFGIKSNHRIGRFSDVSDSQEYTDRIEAINFALAHDDGQSTKSLVEADVILVGVSRSGKTPTSLYLAMQHGIKAANYPLIPEDFERGQLPASLAPFKAKCFGLTIDPERLARIRNERRPNSKYASIENCRWEVKRSRGDDEARGHRLALVDAQVDRGNRDDDPARRAAGSADVLSRASRCRLDRCDHAIATIVPFPPGGVADTVAGPVAEARSRELKRPVQRIRAGKLRALARGGGEPRAAWPGSLAVRAQPFAGSGWPIRRKCDTLISVGKAGADFLKTC